MTPEPTTHTRKADDMDAWTRSHLDAWLERAEHPEYIDATREAILTLVAGDPELLDTHSWPQLRDLAAPSCGQAH